MKVTTITRTVSGYNYDNVSATAIVEENEDILEAIKALDATLKQSLYEIEQRGQVITEQEREKSNTISLLQDALKYAKERDIPF